VVTVLKIDDGYKLFDVQHSGNPFDGSGLASFAGSGAAPSVFVGEFSGMLGWYPANQMSNTGKTTFCTATADCLLKPGGLLCRRCRRW
jgi:hypothetical protein